MAKTVTTLYDTADYLKSDEDMRLYFEVVLEEDPGDGSLIRHALGVIARARGMTQLARDTGLAREGKSREIKGSDSLITHTKS